MSRTRTRLRRGSQLRSLVDSPLRLCFVEQSSRGAPETKQFTYKLFFHFACGQSDKLSKFSFVQPNEMFTGGNVASFVFVIGFRVFGLGFRALEPTCILRLSIRFSISLFRFLSAMKSLFSMTRVCSSRASFVSAV